MRVTETVIGTMRHKRPITRCGCCDRPVWLDTTGQRQTWKHGQEQGFVEQDA